MRLIQNSFAKSLSLSLSLSLSVVRVCVMHTLSGKLIMKTVW